MTRACHCPAQDSLPTHCLSPLCLQAPGAWSAALPALPRRCRCLVRATLQTACSCRPDPSLRLSRSLPASLLCSSTAGARHRVVCLAGRLYNGRQAGGVVGVSGSGRSRRAGRQRADRSGDGGAGTGASLLLRRLCRLAGHLALQVLQLLAQRQYLLVRRLLAGGARGAAPAPRAAHAPARAQRRGAAAAAAHHQRDHCWVGEERLGAWFGSDHGGAALETVRPRRRAAATILPAQSCATARTEGGEAAGEAQPAAGAQALPPALLLHVNLLIGRRRRPRAAPHRHLLQRRRRRPRRAVVHCA